MSYNQKIVLEALENGMTAAELAKKLDGDHPAYRRNPESRKQIARSALFKLLADGKVRRERDGNANRWWRV